VNVKLALLYIFVWNISHSKRNSARYDYKLLRSSCKVPVILVVF